MCDKCDILRQENGAAAEKAAQEVCAARGVIRRATAGKLDKDEALRRVEGSLDRLWAAITNGKKLKGRQLEDGRLVSLLEE